MKAEGKNGDRLLGIEVYGLEIYVTLSQSTRTISA